jgi:hypothetical protein
MLVFLSVSSFAQVNKPDTVILVPSYDSAEVSPVDSEASFEGDGEDVSDAVKETDTDKNTFLPIGAPGSGPDSFSQRRADTRLFKNDDDFWYANATFKKKTEEKKKFQDTSLYQTLLWLVVVGGFIAFLIIYLSNSNISLFRKSKSMVHLEGDVATDDIFAINYNSEIEKAVAAGNYRLAVRLLFLRLLRGLSDRNIIQYTHDRTNLDYLLQVHHAPWYQQFFRITRNYEYVWYGQFDIDQSKFDSINKDFESLERQLPAI